MDAGNVGITPEETAIFTDAVARVRNEICEEVTRMSGEDAVLAAIGYEGSITMFPHLSVLRIPGSELDGSRYEGFVYGTFRSSLRRPHWQLQRLLKRPGSVITVAVPAEGETVYVGWMACVPAQNRIVACYTKAAYRASPEQRNGREENADAFRIASSLALSSGINFDRPVSCSFWSRAARAIAEKPGNPYSLRFDPEERR